MVKKTSIKPKSNKEGFKEKIKHLSPAPNEEIDKDQRKRRTDEEINKDKRKELERVLTQKADPLLVPIIRMCFNIWPYSVLAQIPKGYTDIIQTAEKALLITQSEAEAIALPATQLKNYYLPQVNPILFAWANLGSAIIASAAIRVTFIRELKTLIGRKGYEETYCICEPLDFDKETGLCRKCKKKVHQGRLPKKNE